MSVSTYDARFYDAQREQSHEAACSILPMVFDLCRPTSVVDVGCGVGTWLAAARSLGADDTFGLEGAWVFDQSLMIPEHLVGTANLEEAIRLPRKFDLAMSLEVAEHLSPARADGFVDDLCGFADVVLFSAACPGQDGDGHLNEQWPSYWAKRFVDRGYLPLDLVRPGILRNKTIPSWYRNNIVLYVAQARVGEIMSRVTQDMLRGLDVMAKYEAVGLKPTSKHLLHYSKEVALFATDRMKKRLPAILKATPDSRESTAA